MPREKHRIKEVSLEGKIYHVGYKVLTKDMKSLGLRKNHNILTYPINKWFYLPEEKIIPGKKDEGGIWVARTLSDANKLRKYMLEKNTKTRVFKAAIDQVLYSNSYRIKTNGVLLFEEV